MCFRLTHVLFILWALFVCYYVQVHAGIVYIKNETKKTRRKSLLPLNFPDVLKFSITLQI